MLLQSHITDVDHQRVEDDNMTLNAKNMADVVVYLSIANGFMREEDVNYIKQAIRTLKAVERKNNSIKPLSNLFIVASQAHVIQHGNLNELNNILDKGCKRFYNQITDKFWKNREQVSGCQYTDEIFRSRFFAYTTDIERIRQKFELQLKEIVEILPININRNTIEHIKEFSKRKEIDFNDQIKQFQSIIEKRNEYKKALEEIRRNEPERIRTNQEHKIQVLNKISYYNDNCISEFNKRYNIILDVDNIVSIIEKKDYKNKKEDIKLLAGYVNSLIEDELEDILKSASEDLKDEINKYIDKFRVECDKAGMPEFWNKLNNFDAKRAFASGLAGVATFGGLAIWASTLGNLGAYILVAKGVSLLSALGISVGGTATAATAVAALGGPVVLGTAC